MCGVIVIIIVPMALYGADAWRMRSAEGMKVNVIEIKCLRSLVAVARMEMKRSVGELECKVKWRVVERIRDVEMVWACGKNGWAPYGQKGVDGGSKWKAGTRETEVRLEGCCEGGLGQQRNDGGGCATMRERYERVESPGASVTE